MERHFSLIQWILEHIEQKSSIASSTIPTCKKYTPEQLHYHIGLCQQAGYIEAEIVSGAEERYPRYEVGSLTWKGHEELDRLRD